MLTEFVSSWFRPRSQHALHVREVRDWCELQRLQTTWNQLFLQTPAASLFQSWEWFARYWPHFGSEQGLRILIVEDSAGSPIGIVPMTLRTEPSPLGLIRRLGFPLDNWGTQYGPIGGHGRETLAAAFQFLRSRRKEWDVVDLRWVPAESCSDYIHAWRSAGMHFQQKLWSRTARIDLSQGWDSYWNSRTSKWRNNQRRCDKLLAKLGPVRIEHFRPDCGSADPRQGLFDLCEQVAAASWQGVSSTGNTLNHRSVRAFLREVHVAAANLGRLHLSLLYINQRPAAFTYNFLERGSVLGLRMGYDLQFQAAGAGAVLMRETIRECCQRGDQIFDLGESPSAFKRHFANDELETFRFCHYSASPQARALRIKGWLGRLGR